MSRKICIILALLLLATTGVSASSIITFRASSGTQYRIIESFVGQFQGQVQVAEILNAGRWRLLGIMTRDQNEIKRAVLNEYVLRRGDTIVMTVGRLPLYRNLVAHKIIVEMRSATQWYWWLLEWS